MSWDALSMYQLQSTSQVVLFDLREQKSEIAI